MHSHHPGLIHPKYRADIDGLRAVAVLSVLIFHAFPEYLSGGFVGVDVFFVISGYLISTIIFENIAKDQFSFVDFYIRRIQRIFPALFLVLTASYIFGWFHLLADDFAQLGKHIAGGAGFISNFILWTESGYFDQAAELKPLLHLWSLGIEEQFYFVWPLLIWWLARWPKRVLPVILGIAILSFGLNLATINSNPVATFYSPITRFWELLIGALLAYGVTHHPLVLGKMKLAYRNALSWLGLGLILLSAVMLNSKSTFPGWLALMPALGAALMIGVGSSAHCNRSVLRAKVLVWFGLISFPLYLWHWPLLVFAKLQWGQTPALEMRIVLVLASIALAWITYRFVERPIRFRASYRVQKNIGLIFLMALIGFLGFNCFDRKGIEFRHQFLIQEISSYTFDKVAEQRQHTCFLMDKGDDLSNFTKLCIREDRPFKLVLWGDSHAGALYPGFRDLERQDERIGVTQFTAAGCGGLLPIEGQGPFCSDANALAFKEILRIKPHVVVIYKDWHPLYFPEIEPTLQKLKDANIEVIVIGPTPHWAFDLPRVIYRFWKTYRTLPPLYTWDGIAQNVFIQEKSLQEIEERNRRIGHFYSEPICNGDGCSIPRRVIDADLRRLVQSNGGIYYSAYDRFCNEEGCLNRIPGPDSALTTLDKSHITPAAAIYLVQGLWQADLDGRLSRAMKNE